MVDLLTEQSELSEAAAEGLRDPYFLGNDIIGLSDDELPRPEAEMRPYYTFLDRDRPEWMSPKQKWLRFWSAPRFTGKTYAVCVWLTCCILRWPNIRIIVQCEEKSMAIDSVNLVREWLESKPIVHLYGEQEGTVLWQKSEFTVKNRTRKGRDPTMRASGLDVPMQGKRCDINWWDDLIGETNYESPDALKKAEERVRATMPVIIPGGVGLYTCTRWSPYDMSSSKKTLTDAPGIINLYNAAIEKGEKPVWDCPEPRGWFGAIAQPGDELLYPHAKPGDALFPTVLPLDELENLKVTMASKLYFSQILNDPVPEEDQIFMEDDIQHFDVFLENGDLNPVLEGAVPFMAVDPASGRKRADLKQGDDSAIALFFVKWLKQQGEEQMFNVYLVDWVGGRWKPSELHANVFDLVRRWRPRKIFFEINTGGEHILAPLRQKAKEMGMTLPIDEFYASKLGTGDKPTRIVNGQTWYAYRQVWHSRKLKNCKGEGQMVHYTKDGAVFDDWLDCLMTGIAKATARKWGGRPGANAVRTGIRNRARRRGRSIRRAA